MLHCAKGSLSSVKPLLDKYPELLNNPDQYGITPFYSSIKHHKLDVAHYLYTKGADVNTRNKAGQSILFWSSANNCFRSVKYLLELGADVNCSDKVTFHLIVEWMDTSGYCSSKRS